MAEDPLKRASSTACCTTGLSGKETLPIDEERQIFVDAMAETSESSCPEEKSPPRFEIYFIFFYVAIDQTGCDVLSQTA